MSEYQDNGILVLHGRFRVFRDGSIGNGVIARWETSSPTVEKLKAVADYFGVTIDCLLSDAPELK